MEKPVEEEADEKHPIAGETLHLNNRFDREEDADAIVRKAVCATVWYTMSRIMERSPVPAAAVPEEKPLIKSAVYTPEAGEVALLGKEG